jgi:RNA polymerase sigma-70 factor (ECF subfamily)
MMEPSHPEIDWPGVYDDYMPRVYNFFRYRVRDNALAEDLTATTFEKAWKMRSTYRADRSGVYTWLLTIARSAVADHFRQTRSEEALSDDRAADTARRPVEDHILQDDTLMHLSALMEGLTPRERELVALKYGAGLTNRVIADLTGLSESNVGTTLSRIVHLLRSRWDVRLCQVDPTPKGGGLQL